MIADCGLQEEKTNYAWRPHGNDIPIKSPFASLFNPQSAIRNPQSAIRNQGASLEIRHSSPRKV